MLGLLIMFAIVSMIFMFRAIYMNKHKKKD